jgi:hypothetical protein
MVKQHCLSYIIIILSVGFAATATTCIGPAFGGGPPDTLSAPMIESIDGKQTRGLQLKQPGAVDVQSPEAGGAPPETGLLLVTGQSCRALIQNTPLSALPLLGGGDRNGDWVLLAGLGWNKDSGFGAKGPVLIETGGRLEPVNWYFTVEMLFVPEGRWSVRASLAIDGEELHDALAAPDPQLNPLHIGVAIGFDSGDNSPLVLELGYGRLPLEGRVLSVRPDGVQPDQVLSETRIFSACLNIQF